MRLSALPDALVDRFGTLESAVPDSGRKNASVALVLRPGSPDLDPALRSSDVLVIKRADSGRDPWSGQMALPGGRLDASDPSLLAAAVRETMEETALDLDERGRIIGRIETVRPMGVKLPVITIWPFVFRTDADASARKNSHEVAEVHWFPLQELMDEKNRGTYEFKVGGGLRPFPCIRLEGQVIWGLTYRILTRFFEVV